MAARLGVTTAQLRAIDRALAPLPSERAGTKAERRDALAARLGIEPTELTALRRVLGT